MNDTEFIVRPRCSGKTTAMLEWMAAQPEDQSRVCVTITEGEANRLRRLAKERGLNIDGWRFVSAWNLMQGGIRGRSLRPPRLGVDNAEMVLEFLLGERVDFVTATGTLH